MRIIAWNLKNIGFGKLGNTFSPAITAAGLGNNVGDYILKVVMGQAVWNNILPAAFPDIFVMVELKSGGSLKGAAANGTAIPCLAAMVANMNMVANAGLGGGINPNFQYQAVVPQVIGWHETVGVIYNHQALNLTNSGVLRDNVNAVNFLPRAPFWAEFTYGGGANTLNVVGIHAPPPGGGGVRYYRNPIRYANNLTRSNQLDLANLMVPEDTFVMGDFNTDPTNTYGAAPGIAFAMPGYATTLPAMTLTSMRRRIVAANPTPTDYLSDAFDNVMHAFPNGAPGGGVVEMVPDLIQFARNMNPVPPGPPVAMYPGNRVMLLNNYWKVSDHLPVVFQF